MPSRLRLTGVACPWQSPLPVMLVSLLIGLVAFSNLACDPSHPVTYDNRTNKPVTVFLNDAFSASLEPMQKKTFDIIAFSEATFEARESDGHVIYSETFTWEELKEAGWRIVITENMPSPTPTETR